VDWLTEPFQYDFMQRALAAGLLAAVATAVIGTWVVIRGMSFLSDALAHGVLPGIALAFVWGIDPTIGAAVSAAVMVVGVGAVGRHSRLGQDSSIGLLFVGMLALGVVIISRSGSYAGDLNSFLFGNPLGVTTGDLVVATAAAAIVVTLATVWYRPFLVLCFNRDKAALLGLRPGATNLMMLGLIAVAVVTSYQAVGTLLVSGLLIAPPATASLIARRVPVIMALAALLGAASVTVGLVVSYHYDTAAGATAAATAVGLFFVVAAITWAARALASRRRYPAATPVSTDSTDPLT
jgi:ABC-type Mn2+/Zn2+ transport system permease subunit